MRTHRLSLAVVALFAAALSCGGNDSPGDAPADPASSSRDLLVDGVDPALLGADATPEPTGTPHPSPSSTVRFIALGDTGTGASGQMDVAAAAAAKCAASGCDFGLLLGDNFYSSGVTSATDPQFQSKFQVPYGPLGIPFYVVLGNHDYGNTNDFARGDFQIEYAKTHPNFVLPAAHYDFEAGPAVFLATDTHRALWNHDGSTAKQTAYFRDVLATSDRPWRIALTHHPVFSNGSHGNVGEYDGASSSSQTSGVKLKPLFDDALCGEADLYLSGHDHNLQVLAGTQACPGTFVVSGAGAKVTSLSGQNDALFEEATLGFAYVVITDESITIEMVDANAETLFSTTLSK